LGKGRRKHSHIFLPDMSRWAGLHPAVKKLDNMKM